MRAPSTTARVITSAARIMVSVFAAFLLAPDVEVKMFAVGLSVAIAVDASIVRMLLVPASMALMGDANWWLPDWLARRLPHVDVEGSALLDEEMVELISTSRHGEARVDDDKELVHS